MYSDFFNGIPDSNKGKVVACKKLQYHLLRTGIRVLLNWDWEFW